MDTIREGDVFRFRYSDTTKRFMPYHCFDGQLIAFKQPDGSLLLRDTYWLHACPDFKERSDTRTFTEAEAREQGELAFVCNLGQTDRIEKYALPYYDEADVFDLSHGPPQGPPQGPPHGTPHGTPQGPPSLTRGARFSSQPWRWSFA
jgi:hypothetical protein